MRRSFGRGRDGLSKIVGQRRSILAPFWTAVASAAQHRFSVALVLTHVPDNGVTPREYGYPSPLRKLRRRFALPEQSKMCRQLPILDCGCRLPISPAVYRHKLVLVLQ